MRRRGPATGRPSPFRRRLRTLARHAGACRSGGLWLVVQNPAHFDPGAVPAADPHAAVAHRTMLIGVLCLAGLLTLLEFLTKK